MAVIPLGSLFNIGVSHFIRFSYIHLVLLRNKTVIIAINYSAINGKKNYRWYRLVCLQIQNIPENILTFSRPTFTFKSTLCHLADTSIQSILNTRLRIMAAMLEQLQKRYSRPSQKNKAKVSCSLRWESCIHKFIEKCNFCSQKTFRAIILTMQWI